MRSQGQIAIFDEHYKQPRHFVAWRISAMCICADDRHISLVIMISILLLQSTVPNINYVIAAALKGEAGIQILMTFPTSHFDKVGLLPYQIFKNFGL